jgi:hypothetical protein
MKLLAFLAILLLWLLMDRLVTLPASVHSPAPTSNEWARIRAAHERNK